jgi:group I intron endonuclease
MSKRSLRISGVYQIRCIPTGKMYVGSAVDIRARWGQHSRNLRRGDHPNAHLQQAWNKYGEGQFEFSVLELASKDDLIQVEQKWMDKTRCANREVGFNIFDKAGSPGSAFVQVWEGFIDPMETRSPSPIFSSFAAEIIWIGLLCIVWRWAKAS